MIKVPRSSTGGTSRGESAFTFLSDVVSLLGRATRRAPPARFSFSLPLTAFTLDRSLPLPLGESCSSDLALAATFLLSRLRSLPPHALSKILSHLLSFHRPTFGIASRLVASYTSPGFICVCDTFFVGLYKRVIELFKRVSRKARMVLDLTRTISQSPSTHQSVSSHLQILFLIETLN